jgi:hypothetical protein
MKKRLVFLLGFFAIACSFIVFAPYNAQNGAHCFYNSQCASNCCSNIDPATGLGSCGTNNCLNGGGNGCTPNCAGKQCGPDSCTGNCGNCTKTKTCNQNGICIETSPSTINLADLKNAVIQEISDYFLTAPNYVKLTNPEIKDMVTAYTFATSDPIDLSGIGPFSGERLIDIYTKANEAPTCRDIGQTCSETTPCCTGFSCNDRTCAKTSGGTYSAEIARAVKLDQPQSADCSSYGYHTECGGGCGGSTAPGNVDYTIPRSQTVWFFIDPKEFSGKSMQHFQIFIVDCCQDSSLSATVYTIDKSDNQWTGTQPYSMQLSGNTGAWNPMEGHNDQKRYLLKLTNEDKGTYGMQCNMQPSTKFGVLWWGW